ncbi:MAG: L-idonate 5-dehydrogenase [Gammaproteobacteria bacterium]|nr:MAG: L-idonate 5-dehydrogenase [Gammaproteobacteria bacterium]
MKACFVHAAHDLRISDIASPGKPGADEVRVRYRSGGICGSDIHYYHSGRVGNFDIREPLIIGHEVAGEVLEVGASVTAFAAGDRVAINPSRPCHRCDYCRRGLTNLCEEMVFLGSAAVFPHIQGGFREELMVLASQCVKLPDDLPFTRAAFAEPLAVCLHAVNRAMPVTHQRVLVTGCGPIGCLVIKAARHAGCRSITATDLDDTVLAHAGAAGATETINLGTHTAAMSDYESGRGYFDVAFECSGSPLAYNSCIRALKPRGKLVQLGMMPPGENAIETNRILPKELAILGSFRFHDEFELAVEAIASGRIEVDSLLTGVFAFGQADEAFALATDRRQHMKIQLQWDTP